MSDEKLVSVIIPTYNRAEYLQQAIESVMVQTYTNFELLILDNCSSDHTSNVVSQFNDPRIRYIRHLCNIGSSANWSYGVYLAKGEYVSILCDDDMYGIDFLYQRVISFSLDPKIVSVFGELCVKYEDLEILNTAKVNNSVQIYKGVEAIKVTLNKQTLAVSMFKRQILQAFWEKAIVGGKTTDLLFVGLIAKETTSKIAYLPNLKDYFYRIHPNQDTNVNRMIVAEDAIRVLRMLMEDLPWNMKMYIRKIIIKHLNSVGRIFWDSNQPQSAARCFKNELHVNPLNIITWLRYLRCFYPWNLVIKRR
jgi:glycosyltransferase involved in cell wall biosynthesis